ncbi:HTH-type transcriptional regulator UlaR [Avibacterium sp. 21-595]|uniref:HTH-type transcriptional regulator UlaR n=1 Tax=Avibacterium sp. 21-595 TaxID=2911527 RepID=UPI002026A9C1|nr:HTH-type transcriptional regulator UlaR [Avibacterium sp. 21-595]URL07070.1 HTH-type transcriptional regulator UlaR [Avibacterium sp. 21-595]
MNETYRHKLLLERLAENHLLSTAEIIDLLNISPATARRDINKLHKQGKLRKIRNGAEALTTFHLTSEKSSINHFDEKQRIAQAAARLCKDNESVIITCGSTMQMLGRYLCGRKVQIITNYIPLVNDLIKQNHSDLVIMGGQYNQEKAITLSLNQQNETNYSANIMFTSGRGFTVDGLFKTDMIIAHSEQQLSSKAEKYVVLLDSSKLGKQVGMLFTQLENIDLLITGKEADPQVIEQLTARGLEVRLV